MWNLRNLRVWHRDLLVQSAATLTLGLQTELFYGGSTILFTALPLRALGRLPSDGNPEACERERERESSQSSTDVSIVP